METSLRYAGNKKALRLHAKQKLILHSNTHLQIQGELDTKQGTLNFASAAIRHFFPDLVASFSLGVRHDKHGKQEKFHYTVRGKKAFPVTSDELVRFNIKGRCDSDKEFQQKRYCGAVEFSWAIFNFQRDQDIRLKVGYEVVDQVYTAKKKISKDKGAEPTEFEESVAQALFDLENTNTELKSDLKDLYINAAV